jgi:hypothetical protein
LAQVGTDDGIPWSFDFQLVALVLDAKAEPPKEAQLLPEAIAQSSISNLTARVPESEPICPTITTPPLVRVPFAESALDAQIDSPDHCATELPAGTPITVRGSGEDVPDGAFLWLFVYAPSDRYYPQCDDALQGFCSANPAQGVWDVRTLLGQPNCRERFHIVLIEIDEDGNEFVTDMVRVWAAAGDYRGFTVDELQEYTIRELDFIEVETDGETCP